MTPQPKVTLVASSAVDRLLDISGNVIKEQPGGPALFISSVFKQQKIDFSIQTIGPILVEILLDEDEEKGRILNRKLPIPWEFSTINTPALVISTILDDIDLSSLGSYKGRVFIDAQGFVRDGSEFGKKHMWTPPEKALNVITCLKATMEEALYIDKDVLEQLKQRMLLITNGTEGSTLYCMGQRHHIKPKNIVDSENTIGAGDTFFAYFISYVLKDLNPWQSLEKATEDTSAFLSHK